jgi:ABC-2 type transport system ATP-binding protein
MYPVPAARTTTPLAAQSRTASAMARNARRRRPAPLAFGAAAAAPPMLGFRRMRQTETEAQAAAPTQARPTVLALAGVCKSYGPVKALDDVSFTAAAGELLVLLGPNGAGKSTLVQLLAGFFAADRGTIRILGHDLPRQAVHALRNIGVIFQQQTLDLQLTVAANLRYHAALHGLDRRNADERIGELLQRFALAQSARTAVAKLSGGTRRRLELARALLHRPRLLIMDEASAGLDPAARRDVLRHVADLCARDGVTVLWTTHLVDEAEAADRLVFLNRGRVAFDGTAPLALARTGCRTVGEAFLAITGGQSPTPLATP